MNTVWVDTFRRQVTEGITSRSKFVVLGSWNFYPLNIISCSSGFLVFVNEGEKTFVKLIDPRGGLTTLREIPRTLYAPQTWPLLTGEVIIREGDKYINLETGERSLMNPWERKENTLREVIKGLFRHPKKVVAYREVTQFHSRPGDKVILKNNDDNCYYFVAVGTKSKIHFDLVLEGVIRVHCYRDVLYTNRVWKNLSPLFSVWKLDHTQIFFSGMHSILADRLTGLLFFYNLSSKEITLLNTETGEIYSEREFYRINYDDIPKKTYEYHFVTVDGVLYILIWRGDATRLISHRVI